MIALISRTKYDGTWPDSVEDRFLLRVKSESGAMDAAKEFAGPRSYRIELWDNDRSMIDAPCKVIEQAALPFTGGFDV